MAYVITQNCCKDASCVPVCPVDCIRPVGNTDAEMLYIDPESCIDCGACMEECPVGAIHYEDDLTAELEAYREINAAYFRQHPSNRMPGRPANRTRRAGGIVARRGGRRRTRGVLRRTGTAGGRRRGGRPLRAAAHPFGLVREWASHPTTSTPSPW